MPAEVADMPTAIQDVSRGFQGRRRSVSQAAQKRKKA